MLLPPAEEIEGTLPESGKKYCHYDYYLLLHTTIYIRPRYPTPSFLFK
jgi:hypothetical protein